LGNITFGIADWGFGILDLGFWILDCGFWIWELAQRGKEILS
jgi:hypothetical protein